MNMKIGFAWGRGVFLSVLAMLLLSSCSHQPPSVRPPVEVSEFTAGDAKKGKVLYDEVCEKCHKLVAGQNKKGPQLMNIYGSKAGLLKDYKYSEVLLNSGWVWNAEKLDVFITDAQKALPKNRMHADGIDNAEERADIIAYLSTLRDDQSGQIAMDDKK